MVEQLLPAVAVVLLFGTLPVLVMLWIEYFLLPIAERIHGK